MVIQVSGFDDKVNILGLVTGTNNLSPSGVGGLVETGDLLDREGLILVRRQRIRIKSDG